MRIAFFNWRDMGDPRAGGSEVFAHRVLALLAKSHKVTLFTSGSRGRPERETIDGVEHVRFGGRFSIYALSYPCYKKHVEGRYDIIIESINGVPFFTPLFARERVVSFIHQLTRENWYSGLPLPLAFIGYHVEDLLLAPYHGRLALVPSESTRSDLLRLGFRDVRVIEEAADITPPAEPRKARARTVAYLGRLARSKRVDHVLEAFAKILRACPGARLIIAGSGPEERRLMKLASRLGIAGSTEFAGRVSEERKAEILSSSHLALFPGTREGWGLVVLEANACGTPVIGYDVPGLRDSIRDGVNGFLVPEGDADAMAAKSISLLKDTKALEKLSAGAKRHSEKFSWERTARELAAALEGS
jgi:glycosyltransferase involved in cell wall biosynthesis